MYKKSIQVYRLELFLFIPHPFALIPKKNRLPSVEGSRERLAYVVRCEGFEEARPIQAGSRG
jgi:hypothetical protein